MVLSSSTYISRTVPSLITVVVNVMDVTRGQRDINLHVISKTVIEWLQKWRAVVCCCHVIRLSSGVCVVRV